MEERLMEGRPLSYFELGNELYTLVENNVIPSYVAERIRKKIKDADVKLTKNHLYQLVEEVKKAIKKYPQDDDVQKIFDTIQKLSKRIKRIEEISIRRNKGHLLEEISRDPESIIVLMRWLQYLMNKVGKANLSSVLQYYADIGWISDKSIKDILEYSEGITEEKKPEGNQSLQAKDHIQSLLFIQRLKGEQPDGYFLSRIERDISKMTRGMEGIK